MELESDLIEVNDSEIRSFEGYRLVKQNGFIKYTSEQSHPLPVHIREKDKLHCPCYGKLYILTYRYNDGNKVSNKIVGRKCSKCGKNYFTPKSIQNNEQYFEFIEAQDNENFLGDLISNEENSELVKAKKLKASERYMTSSKENSESAKVNVKISKEILFEDEKIEPSNDKSVMKTGKLCKRDDDSIPPILHEVGNVEKLAAGEKQSSEGAWWIMLQTAMSIYNCAVTRDPVNNAVMDEFWCDITKRDDNHGVEPLLQRGGTRPLPYDDLMEIISYCGDQLQNVIDNPRHSIVKVDKMVIPYRVRNTGTRTMDWLGKQPGKTIKEKISGKNKMLIQVNEYSYDIKENQVTMMLYRMLLKRVNERINNGIGLKGYDDDYDSPNISKMIKIKKGMRNSKIAEIKPINHTQANNVLLSDRNYSVIWKAYLDMCKYDRKITRIWDKALQSYVRSIFIAINAALSSYSDIQTIEKRINLSKEGANNVVHIVGYETERPLVVKISYDEFNIHLSIFEANLNNSGEKILGKYKLIFGNDESTDLMEKRGYPILVQIRSGENIPNISIYADIDGVNTIVNWFLLKVEMKYGQLLSYFEEKIGPIYGTCTFDVISDGMYTTVNEELLPYTFGYKAIVYNDENSDKKVFRGNNQSVYPEASEQIKISDAVNKRLQTEALMNALEDISHTVTLNQDDYFIYTVPDALEEFSQKNLKQCVNTWFHRTFPVWRSVAALTEILSLDNSDFKPDDMFVSVDLMGDTATAGILTIKQEKKVNGYVCNHYPPFPESDTGEHITERAFIQLYVKKYFEKYGIEDEGYIIREIVESGIVQSVLIEGYKRNYTIQDSNGIRLIQIGLDNDVLQECRATWLKNFRLFWRDIKHLFPQNIQYVDILSDCVMNFIEFEDAKSIVGCDDGFTGIYLSNSSNINKGAYTYIDRLRYHKPTWTEYLPELSLEVIKDGKYKQLQLIGNDISFDVIGADNEHVVGEKLLLKANEKEFRFPLIKKDISRTSSMIEAFISDKSFPLDNDVVVTLTVRYKYGFDNSYEVVLKPENSESAPFDEILVKWEEGVRKPKEEKYPIYPELMNKDKVLSEIELVNNGRIWSENLRALPGFRTIENNIERFFVYYDYENVSKNINFGRLTGDLTCHIFRIRNIIIHNDMPEVNAFIEEFYNSNLAIYLGELSEMVQNKNISDGFFNDYYNSNELKNLACSAMQLLYSFGSKTPEFLQQYLLKNYYDLDVIHKDNVLMNMLYLNSDNYKIMEIIISEVQDFRKMDGCIRELSSLCWFDSKMIYSLGRYPAFIKAMIDYISNDLHDKKNINLGTDFKFIKKQQKRYLRYVEMILAILRLRATEDFSLLRVDSSEARKLVEDIRVVDDVMKNPRSKIQLKVNKPDSLRNMSDIAYAIDMYLTGNEGVDSIEVVSVESE